MESFERVVSPSAFARANLFYAILGGLEAATSHFMFERSYYPAYEMLFVTQGKGWFRHGGTWIELMRGDCLLHDMRVPHAYRANPADPYEMRYLVFDGIDLEPLWSRLFNAPLVFIPSRPPDSPLDALLRTILDWMREDSPRNERTVSALIYQLLLQAQHEFNHERHRAPSMVKPGSIEQARKYIDARYLDSFDMKQLAREAGLSVFHFIRQFKRYYGCTPKEYVLLKRISHAKRLLLLTDDSIAAVAENSGFANYNTFLHTFHKIEKCSPSEYRKNWKR